MANTKTSKFDSFDLLMWFVKLYIFAFDLSEILLVPVRLFLKVAEQFASSFPRVINFCFYMWVTLHGLWSQRNLM